MHPTTGETRFALKLRDNLRVFLERHFDAQADVSELLCIEASIHFHKDIQKILQTHQSDGQLVLDGQVDPLKIISYMVFWIRKVKPISNCYHKADIEKAPRPTDLEIADINERVSISLGQYLTLKLCLAGRLEKMKINKNISKDIVYERLQKIFANYKDLIVCEDDEDCNLVNKNSVYERMVYDMRFRTFGPHHFTLLLTQAVSMAGSGQ